MNLDLNPTLYTQCDLAFQFLPESMKDAILKSKLVLQSFLTLFSLPLELVLRWRWGTRALPLMQVATAVNLAFLFSFGGLALKAFFLVVAGLALWHFHEARKWEERNPNWPTYRLSHSFGEPVVWWALTAWLNRLRGRKPVPVGEEIIFRFLEPATGLLGLPLLLVPFTKVLGIIILISGFTLFIKRQVIHLRIVDLTRDRKDAVVLGHLLAGESDTPSRPEAGPAFEVRLAAPPAAAIPESPWPPPLPATELPFARVVGVDEDGRPKLECPECLSLVRCSKDPGTRKMTCPKCKVEFVAGARMGEWI